MLHKVIHYILLSCLFCSCKTTEIKQEQLRKELTDIDYILNDRICEYENYMDSTKTYQIPIQQLKDWNWSVTVKPNKYQPRNAIYPTPPYSTYHREDSIPESFYDWLVNQNVVNHRKNDSIFCLTRGGKLKDYSSYINELKERVSISFIGNIKSDSQYNSFLLLVNNDKQNEDPTYAMFFVILVNHQEGKIKSMITVGSYISAGDAIITWTEKNNGNHLLKSQSTGIGILYSYEELKQMRKKGEKFKEIILYYPFSIDKKEGWINTFF